MSDARLNMNPPPKLKKGLYIWPGDVIFLVTKKWHLQNRK